MFNPPIWGKEYITYVSLVDQANTKLFKSNPTLASGDVKISKDGGAEANLSTLPAVTPAGSRHVKITVSATEMQADNVKIVFSDASGAEWCDLSINIQPTKLYVPGSVDNANFTPTSTEFEAGDITEATTAHYKWRLVAWMSGALTGQFTEITAYSLVSGKGHFTVRQMTEAPANTDRFLLV